MLPFRDKFNNDDPLADIQELLALNTWYSTIFLVLGNLAGIFPFLYAHAIGLYFLAYSILLSAIISFFYHLCQTSHECFQMPLPLHVSIDHFTSTSMMGLLLIAEINVRTLCQILLKKRIIRAVKPCTKSSPPPKAQLCPSNQPDLITLLVNQPCLEVMESRKDLCVCGEEMEKHFTYHSVEDNMMYDSWSCGSAITIITVTVIAVYAHPFSYAAFIIVITAVVLLAFIKIMLIEEGEPVNFIGRLSLPELLISLILSAIGLTAYVLDSYFAYEWLHSIWHVAIYLAVMFLLAGTMRSINGWIPLWEPVHNWLHS